MGEDVLLKVEQTLFCVNQKDGQNPQGQMLLQFKTSHR